MLDDSAMRWLRTEVDGVAATNLSEQELPVFRAFTRHFIQIHLAESLLSWNVKDVFGVLNGLYQFASERSSSAPKIKVFNPEAAADGWTSPHTLIYICQRDVSFLVDSLRMALNRLGLNIYLYESHPAWVRRSSDGKMASIVKSAPASDAKLYKKEDLALIQIDYQGEETERENIRQELLRVLEDVVTCVDDHTEMLAVAKSLTTELSKDDSGFVDAEELDFLRWLCCGSFTFLGVSEFERVLEDGIVIMKECASGRLGLMRARALMPNASIKDLSPGFSAFHDSNQTLAFTKSSHRSTVHRAVYSDYVIVKRRNDTGESIGEVRLLGLFTSKLYHCSIRDIPLVRKKAAWLCESSQLDMTSHDGKSFFAILEGHPRDELIQTSDVEMLDIALGIWRIYERRAVRLFMRFDPFENFASCIVYLPRESLTTETRERIEACLRNALDAEPGEFTTQFLSESVLARIHFVFRISSTKYAGIDKYELERHIVSIVRDWNADFREAVFEQCGLESGPRIARLFGQAFQSAYRDQFPPLEALEDASCMATLDDDNDLAMRFFHEPESAPDIMRLKLFRRNASLELSDMIPMLENLGFRVLVEHPHKIMPRDGSFIWMLDFTLRFTMDIKGALDIAAVREHFTEAFLAVWRGETNNDGFNRLVLGARLDWRSAALMRAYAQYLKQLGIPFSVEFMADVLARQLDITRNLLALFRCKFDPRMYTEAKAQAEAAEGSRTERMERLSTKIISELDDVANRNEDELVRRYLALIQATLRTNFFQSDEQGQAKSYLSLKLAVRELDFAPQPRPAFEVYVSSPRVEGVHLRTGKVARGGIRWSDRFEDYRTEVLGLVKAQQVKNAVIVPAGAKGGFIARQSSQITDRDALLAEGIACYKIFISALLDITDNRVDDHIVQPVDVVCVDDEDPYLVVAADKGTATFSDIANDLSDQYGHWLGDAFASGGSNGYDHKGMGITAKGAWVAVQRHFRELDIDIQTQAITVLGIGDMSGDVFGNGMLLSPVLKVVAAFNHLHIFIDPEPNTASSFAERQRLFDLPRSGWGDYDRSLISSGGGVFLRSSKRIPLSAEMKALLGVRASTMAPDDIIHSLLKSKVDLIWNGGVGTYVKSSAEADALVGDRSNDSLRVDGNQLQCRVFGEGGNLGMTQRARIEFCQNGGICNTDFIDNAGGVDCSDNEVNIKILLNELVRQGKLTVQQRNSLLAEMTEEVAELVLRSNYEQTQAISLAVFERNTRHFDFVRFVQFLENEGRLDRQLEYIPDDEEIRDRVSNGTAWTRPELSVLISYAKVMLKEELLQHEKETDKYVIKSLVAAFPATLHQQASAEIENHRLANEIISTALANDIVNKMGFTYCFRQMDSVGASPADVAKAYIVVSEVFGLGQMWADIEALDHQVSSALQYELLLQLMSLGQSASRWYLRNRREIDPTKEIERSGEYFAALIPTILTLHQSEWRSTAEQTIADYVSKGVPADLAGRMAVVDSYFMLPGMIDVALTINREQTEVTRFCFMLMSDLQADWLMSMLIDWQPSNRWQDLARESHVDDLEAMMRKLTKGLLQRYDAPDLSAIVTQWMTDQQRLLNRFKEMMMSLRSTQSTDFSVVTVALRELKDLVDASIKPIRA